VSGSAGPVGSPDPGGHWQVAAQEAVGVQIGQGNIQVIHVHNQVIYSSNGLTWTDRAPTQPLLASPGGTGDSPYRGLSAFEEEDSAFFFGRENAVSDVRQLMRQRLEGLGLLMVSGASGAGKSSLLRAGVLAELRGVGLPSVPAAAQWPCVIFTPGQAPLDELAVRVAVLAGADAAEVRRGLHSDPAGFALTARQALPARSPGAGQGEQQQRLLIIVDQFEQLFTQCPDEAERQRFITALHAAASGRAGWRDQAPALVVLGMRADFEIRCVGYPMLAEALQRRHLVMPMREQQLRMAITEPARIAGARVDDDLAEELLREARGGPAGSAPSADRHGGVFGAGILPLLSHALDQAWRIHTGPTVTLADYERTGRIDGAVAKSAQRAYDGLAPDQQAAARLVFTSMTAVSSDGTVTAARAARADLVQDMDEVAALNVEAVLEAFAAERLVTLAAGTAEVSHEALLTAWPLMRDTWLADAQADRIVRTRLRAAAADWTFRDSDPSCLYSGTLLAEASGTIIRMQADPSRHLPLSQAERDFFRASERAHQKRALRRHAFIATLLLLVMGLAASTIYAFHASGIATTELSAAGSGKLTADSQALGNADGTLARLESVAAWRIDPTPQAGYGMLAAAALPAVATLDVSVFGVTTAAFGRGSTLVTVSGGGGLRLWDSATYRQSAQPLDAASVTSTNSKAAAVDTAAFSPDGSVLAAASSSGVIRLWNMADRARAMKPIRAPNPARFGTLPFNAVAISPGDKTLATADADGTVRVWDIATRRQAISPIVTGTQPVYSAAFSPAGKILATADGDNTVRLWDAATGSPIATLLPGQDGITQTFSGFVTFSPDGSILASVTAAGTICLWDVATHQLIGEPFTGASPVDSVAFSPDGTILASADLDGSVRLWNVATQQQIASPLNGDDGSVSSVSFSQNGMMLASANNNGTVRLWNMSNLFQAATLASGIGHGRGVAVAFGAQGKLLAATGIYGSMVWNAATRRLAGYFAQNLAYPGQAMTVSPGGTTLAVATGDRVVLWNIATRRRIGTIIAGSSLDSSVASVVFSPDGNILALGISGQSNVVQLWDLATHTAVGYLDAFAPRGDEDASLAFSPDGKSLAGTSGGGMTVVWNIASHKQIRGPLIATHIDSVEASTVFSPDGRMLAASDGSIVAVWNTASWHQVGNPFASNQSQLNMVYSMAFSPDSDILAIGSEDGTVQLWDTATDQEIGSPLVSSSIDNGAVRSLAFSPDGQTLAASSEDGAVQIWDTADLVDVAQNLCTVARQSLTLTQWNEYAQGIAYQETCPQYSETIPAPTAFNSP